MTIWFALILGFLVGLFARRIFGRSASERATGGPPGAGPGAGAGAGAQRRRRLPSSTEHVMDLLRRAHGAAAACLVGKETDPVIASAVPTAPLETFDRPISLARLAMADSREHVTRAPDTIIAVGDGSWGIAVQLGAGDFSASTIHGIATELRQLLGEIRVDYLPSFTGETPTRRVEVELPPGLNTLPAIASGLCDRARVLTGRPTAVAVRNTGTDSASVIAVSTNGNRRLLGAVASPQSAVGRACLHDGTITTGSTADLFGQLPKDRRRSEGQGTAYPLRDGRAGVGALIVFGPIDDLDAEVKERVMWLAADAGPRFAAAAAVRQAEERATTDPLTGLPNRTALDQAMANAPAGPCAVLYVDIDHFKAINDRLGHAGGDEALRHVAGVLRSALREGDLPTRTGGEEFVLWLPNTTKSSALEVAERVRSWVEKSRWLWEGSEVDLTCSIGVAATPDTTEQVANLMAAADAALYRAKRAGRNRVVEGRPAG